MPREVLEFVVPATFGITLFSLLFLWLAWMRWMHYRQVIALADRGFGPRDAGERAGGATYRSLRWGLLIAATGLALTLGLWPISAAEFRLFLGLSPILLVGLIPLFVGLALVTYWVITHKDAEARAEAEARRARDAEVHTAPAYAAAGVSPYADIPQDSTPEGEEEREDPVSAPATRDAPERDA